MQRLSGRINEVVGCWLLARSVATSLELHREAGDNEIRCGRVRL